MRPQRSAEGFNHKAILLMVMQLIGYASCFHDNIEELLRGKSNGGAIGKFLAPHRSCCIAHSMSNHAVPQ